MLATSKDINKVLFLLKAWGEKPSEVKPLLEKLGTYDLSFDIRSSRWGSTTRVYLRSNDTALHPLCIYFYNGGGKSVQWNYQIEKKTVDGGIKLIDLVRQAQIKGTDMKKINTKDLDKYFEGKLTVDEALGYIDMLSLRR